MNKNNGLLLKNFNLDCSERKMKQRGMNSWMYTGCWYDCYDRFIRIAFKFITFKLYKKDTYSVTNSTGAAQRFSANHRTSLEQKNRSSFTSEVKSEELMGKAM